MQCGVPRGFLLPDFQRGGAPSPLRGKVSSARAAAGSSGRALSTQGKGGKIDLIPTQDGPRPSCRRETGFRRIPTFPCLRAPSAPFPALPLYPDGYGSGQGGNPVRLPRLYPAGSPSTRAGGCGTTSKKARRKRPAPMRTAAVRRRPSGFRALGPIHSLRLRGGRPCPGGGRGSSLFL